MSIKQLCSAVAKFIFNLLPEQSPILFKVCKRYVDRANGDNDSNPETNGEYALLRRLLPSCRERVVFDVGSNIGEWSSKCMSINPSLNMHLFEPSPVTFKRLQTLAWNESVHLNQVGISDAEGNAELHITENESGMNSLYPRSGVEGWREIKTEQVHLTTIDKYCSEHGIGRIFYLKIDVEGHELSVLKGSINMLQSRSIDALQFEYGGAHINSRMFLLDMWQLLEQFGYQVGKIYPDRVRYYDQYRQVYETFQDGNIIASLTKIL